MPDQPVTPLSLGEGLSPLAEEQPITRAQAVDILRELFGVRDRPGTLGRADEEIAQHLPWLPGVNPRAQFTREVGTSTMRKLVDLLPEGALYESVIRRMDTRMLLAQVMSADPAEGITVGGVTFDENEREAAARFFMERQESARTVAPNLGTATGISDPLNGWRATPGVLTISPDALLSDVVADPERAGQVIDMTGGDASGAGASTFADFMAAFGGGRGGGAKGPTFLTDADVQAMFRLAGSDLSAINAYFGAQSNYAAATGKDAPDTFRVLYDAKGFDPQSQAYVPGYVQAGSEQSIEYQRQIEERTAKGRRSYSISEATNLLYGMSKEEVARMQKMLMQGGYFLAANGENGAEPMFRGDPGDERTQAAWRMLIGDAVRSGVPMLNKLGERTQAATASGLLDEEGKPKPDPRTVPDTRLSGGAAVRLSADELGQREIGRKLNDAEHAKLLTFVHDLERGQQATLNNEVGGEEVTDVDVGAEIQRYLQTSFAKETGGQDVADTYDQFTSLLSGPGGR